MTDAPSVETGTRDVSVCDHSAGPTVSVVICAHSTERRALLLRAIGSITRQTHRAAEIIVVVDHNSALFDSLSTVPGVATHENVRGRGISGARNTGVAAAGGEIIAFLDDDAVADANWVRELTDAYSDPRVIGTGGPIEPEWESVPPTWMPSEFHWVFGCTYRGAPDARTPIRNPIGANMSFRRRVLIDSGGFLETLGRVDARPHGCDETEFAIRASARSGGLILNVPTARVMHFVPTGRLTWSYYRRRCWLEGRSKAVVRATSGKARQALSTEREYVARTLPRGVVIGGSEALRGDFSGLARSAAILAGFLITAAAYLTGPKRVSVLQPPA